jgi:hypothetical protein
MCAPRVTPQTSIRYSSSCHTRVNMGASKFFTAAMMPLGTDHCSSEEYQCTHVDVRMARTLISYRCVPCHPWCTHRTSLVVKKNFFFSFPVAVNKSIKVECLAFLLYEYISYIFVITENIMKRPAFL